jgi:hypothetical protein
MCFYNLRSHVFSAGASVFETRLRRMLRVSQRFGNLSIAIFSVIKTYKTRGKVINREHGKWKYEETFENPQHSTWPSSECRNHKSYSLFLLIQARWNGLSAISGRHCYLGYLHETVKCFLDVTNINGVSFRLYILQHSLNKIITGPNINRGKAK